MCLNSSFFNLLTFNKRVLNLARSESHLLCVVIGCSPLMSHSCAHAPLTRDQAWVDRESWWSASWYQQSQIGVVWFCQLKTNPLTLNLFIYHHGTGPWSLAPTFINTPAWKFLVCLVTPWISGSGVLYGLRSRIGHPCFNLKTALRELQYISQMFVQIKNPD